MIFNSFKLKTLDEVFVIIESFGLKMSCVNYLKIIIDQPNKKN